MAPLRSALVALLSGAALLLPTASAVTYSVALLSDGCDDPGTFAVCYNVAQNQCCANLDQNTNYQAVMIVNCGGDVPPGSTMIAQGYAPQGQAPNANRACPIFAGQRANCFDSGLVNSLSSGKYYLSQGLKVRDEGGSGNETDCKLPDAYYVTDEDGVQYGVRAADHPAVHGMDKVTRRDFILAEAKAPSARDLRVRQSPPSCPS